MHSAGTCPASTDPNSILAAIPIGACLLDAGDFRVVAHNRDYQGMRRDPHPGAEFVGSRFGDHLPEAERGGLLQSLERASGGESAEIRQLPCLSASKDEAYWDLQLRPVQDLEGNVRWVLVTVNEVTEHVRAKQQIDELAKHAEASLRQLETVVNSMSDGLFIVDVRGNVLSMNPAALKMHGFDNLEESQRDWNELADLFELVSPDGTSLPTRDWPAARALRGEKFSNQEVFARRRDTGKSWIGSYGGAPVRDGSGKIVLGVITSRDVTASRKADEDQRFLFEVSRALNSSLDFEQTLNNLANAAVPYLADWCAIDVLEGDGSVSRLGLCRKHKTDAGVTSQVEKHHWADESEIVGPANVLRTGVAELHTRISDKSLKARARSSEDLENLRTLGLTSAMIVPLKVRDKIVGALTLVSTESKRHYAQTDLRLAKEVARRAAISVENARLYREAQQAIRSRDEFLSVAAHELKTPITSLIGFAQLAMRAIESGEGSQPIDRRRIHRTMEIIDQQSRKLSRLVSQLLDVSRVEAGRLVLRPEATDVAALVQSVAANARVMAHHHTIKVSAPPNLPAVLDPLRFEQVVTNLLDNAVKYSPPGGPIEIVVSSLGQEGLRLEVRDHGTGIPPENRHQMFDRFYQAHADSYASGMGLGLHISQQIIGLHGGKLEAEFPEDGGTRFIVTLPVGVQDAKF